MSARYIPYSERHGLQSITIRVADVTDAEAFPNIAEAVRGLDPQQLQEEWDRG